MPPTNRISGKKIAGTIGGNAISGVHSYDVDDSADDLDATVGADSGFTRTDTGCKSLTLTLNAYFDLAEATIAPVESGAWVENLNLYDEHDSTPFLTMAYGKVVKFTKRGEVRGRLEYTAVIKNWGEFTYTESPG
jgi:hypothetical protein